MTFLIVRPEGKAEKTLTAFNDEGLIAQALPILHIELSQQNSDIVTLKSQIPNYIIVTSTYAAQWLLGLITNELITFNLNKVKFICVGSASAKLLAPFVDDNNVHVASPENSEGILSAPYLQNANNKNIVLLKGEGGRDLIETTLIKQNTSLRVINVYKRVANIHLIRGFTFEPSQIRCIIATSIEIAEILLCNIDKRWLASCQWIVASERIKEYVHNNDIVHISVSQGASNEALLACAHHIVKTGVMHD